MSRLLCLLFAAALSPAHPGRPSMWTVFVNDGGITGRIVVPGGGPESLRYFTLRSGAGTATPILKSVERQGAGSVELLVRYELQNPRAGFELSSTFFELVEIGHETLCRVHMDGRVETFRLNLEMPSKRIETDATGAHAAMALASLFLFRFAYATIRDNIKRRQC